MNHNKGAFKGFGKDKSFKSSRLYWVNILLLAVNVSMLVAFSWYLIASDTKLDSRLISNSNEFLKNELKLSQDQYKRLNELDRVNFEKTQVILKLMCDQRNALLEEISKDEPSRERLNEITKRTGFLYRGMNNQSVRHLLNIKEICDDVQKEKMNEIFRELVGIDDNCKYCKHKCEKSKFHK